MNTAILQLNLARKWRSKTFDQVIGQDLSVRILKNSLYLDHYFPVYLFSGQHGCGKTTMARIFAAAVNCQQLSVFQQNPKESVLPCLSCDSCKAMASSNHPDFIEIDGASHTGVDNVRQIIEVAAFLPIMGRKKIYLIDEAHMLSKAAFNAFLKILEEPPVCALFILATTELHKIIETVRSRSFQLFFRAVEEKVLAAHLAYLCQQESIVYDAAGIEVIVKHTKGSVRDAINLLEQIRFASSAISKKAVLEVLQYADDELIITLFDLIQSRKPEQLLDFIQAQKLQTYAIEGIYKSLIELITSCVWVFYGQKPCGFVQYGERIKQWVQKHPISYFTDCLTALFEFEQQLSKTDAARQLFEMVLLRLCLKNGVVSGPGTVKKELQSSGSHMQASQELPKKSTPVATTAQMQLEAIDNSLWSSFINQVEQFDPLLSSIFKQGIFGGFDQQSTTVTIVFGKEFTVFEDMLEKSSAVWKPLLSSLVGKPVRVKAQFQEAADSLPISTLTKKITLEHKDPVAIKKAPVVPPKPVYKKSSDFVKTSPDKMEKKTAQVGTGYLMIDTTNKDEWKKANLLKSFFPGTIYELPEGV